ncbi:histidine-type phosphatase [Serratia rubidaea]|uniref:histidine-type phosphatase n=1 Tax=Serratia rubidaea TaxID=61652 RepID=UPI0022B91CF5|nr:histidine-type phosphatase [Serratia rubidaea]WBF46322.1 histidine-type phosphatase [Serratia rubidaea]
MFRLRKLLAGLFFTAISINSALAASSWTLEKVVEVSRHGVRPPTAGNRSAMEAGSGRAWPVWYNRDGELTGHGYAAALLKGQAEAENWRQHGLLPAGCPAPGDLYVWASPLQRTRATARALTDGAFPGCGVAIHGLKGDHDPLFHALKMGLVTLDPQQTKAAIDQAMKGSPERLKQRYAGDISRLKQAVCAGDHCPVFDEPWTPQVSANGKVAIQGLNVLSNMAETIRLAWSENLPPEQVAFGHARNATEVAALMPLLTLRYSLTNDIPLVARRGGSVLLNQIALALQPGKRDPKGPPEARWLLIVAHDTNIAFLRTLLGFNWQQGNYPQGNIPPAGSLVFERWRDNDSGQRYIRILFQSQSLDQLRNLTPPGPKHPLLKTEYRAPGCRTTGVGTLCPLSSSLEHMHKAIDSDALPDIGWHSEW